MSMEPCCARLQSVLHSEEANLRRLARMASNRQSRGLSVTKTLSAVEAQKTQIEAVKRNIVDHEADHSGEMC